MLRTISHPNPPPIPPGEPDDELELLSVSQAAPIVQVGESTLRQAIRDGHLAHRRVGRHVRLTRADLRAWIDSMAAIRSPKTAGKTAAGEAAA